MREIHGMYRISLDELSLERVEELKALLTLISSVSDTFGFSEPVRLECWREGDGYIEVPREFGRKFFGPASDCMVRTDPVDFTFNGTLRDKQIPVIEEVLGRGEPSGIVRMPCGTGKTVVALKLISHWRQRAIVLVHKGFLVGQWKKRINEFLGIPIDDIGHIQQDHCDYDHPITICMIQSLVGEREYPPELFNSFGVVVSDECISGDSEVITDKGKVKIEDFPSIKPTLMLSFDEALLRWEYRRIIRWIPRGERQTLVVKAGNYRIRCTLEHLFLTVNGWVAAQNLRKGMKILSPALVVAGSNSQDSIVGVESEDSSHTTRFGADRNSTGREGVNCLREKPLSVPVDVDREFNCQEVSRVQGLGSQDGRNAFRATMRVVLRGMRLVKMFSGFFMERFLVIHPLLGHTSRRIREFCSRMGGFSGNGQNTRLHGLSGLESKRKSRKMLDLVNGVAVDAVFAIPGYPMSFPSLEVQSAFQPTGFAGSQMRGWLGGTWTMDQSLVGESCSTLRAFAKKMSRCCASFFEGLAFRRSGTRLQGDILLRGLGSKTQSYGSIDSKGSPSQAWSTSSLLVSGIEEGHHRGEPVYDIEVEGNHNFIANGFLVHNCHRISAPKWRFAIEKFPAAIRLGLSATPWRGDGLDDVFKWHMGRVMASAQGQEMKPDIYRVMIKTVVPNARKYRMGQGEKQRLNLAKLITDLSVMKHRTVKIAKYLVQALAKERKILLLSHRRPHLDDLEEEVKFQWERTQSTPLPSIGRYVGGMKESDLEDSEICDLILATFQMAKEALDIPAIDVLVLATPAGDVTQPVGRTTRWCDEKKKPIVLDFVDRIETLPELNFLSEKRLRVYSALKCDFPRKKED